MNKIILLVVSILIINTFNQGIVDFQYTQYTQSAHRDFHHRANLQFQPIQLQSENLQFPSACTLIDQLQQPLKQKQSQIIEADIDVYLHDMKQKFLQLLNLTQKLTNSQAKILHFEGLINKTIPIAPSQDKIRQLEEYEKSLRNLTNQIRQKQQKLNAHFNNIKKLNDQTNSFESKRIELDFNIDLMKQKISYLKQLQSKVRFAIQNSQSQNDYNKYFDELQNQFKDQTQLIQSIDAIIRKKDDLTRLRKQKANLESSIMALDLYIKDVELCHKQKENIRQEFKNHQKINQLILELKQLKKNQEPNIYCEGVVKKLTQKIKTMLRYYDIVASCASDLSEKMNSLRKQREQLAEIIQKIAYLESMQNLEDFQKTYNSQKSKIQRMYTKIKDWKIKQFTHDPEQIASIRQKTESQLQDLLNQRQSASFTESHNQKSISITIFDLINSLKEAKAQYCILYHKYDSFANSLWTEAHQYQSEMSLKNKLLSLEYEQRLRYDDMHRQLFELRAKIYEKLNK